jgi:antitoxin component YwqK of YwqJK toxin-antitoxin module
MKILVLLFVALLVAGCGEKSLSDSKIEKALEEAVLGDSLQERNELYYQPNKSKPYSGWVKEMHDSEQVAMLVQLKDGKLEGRSIAWHENGQKAGEGTFKDGELISAKYWNSKGEEVETEEEAEE